MPIAFMGPAHSFSERAAHALAPGAALTPQPDIAALFAALRCGDADQAVVPLENSQVGAVPATLAELAALARPLGVVAEITLPIRFSLYVRPGPVRRIASHAMSLRQCAPWLARQSAAAEEVGSTGTAIARAALGAEPGLAAIGPKGLTVPGLTEAETDLQGEAAFATRFLLLAFDAPATAHRAVVAVEAATSLQSARALGAAPSGETIAEAHGPAPWPGRPLLLWRGPLPPTR